MSKTQKGQRLKKGQSVKQVTLCHHVTCNVEGDLHKGTSSPDILCGDACITQWVHVYTVIIISYLTWPHIYQNCSSFPIDFVIFNCTPIFYQLRLRGDEPMHSQLEPQMLEQPANPQRWEASNLQAYMHSVEFKSSSHGFMCMGCTHISYFFWQKKIS